MKMTAQEYARRVQKAGPHSPLLADCLWAFCVGGGICLLGEGLRQLFLRQGADAEAAGTLTSCTLILLSAVLTTLGWYQKLAAKAGAKRLWLVHYSPMITDPEEELAQAQSLFPAAECGYDGKSITLQYEEAEE